jgi:hypothetical protein
MNTGTGLWRLVPDHWSLEIYGIGSHDQLNKKIIFWI